MIRSLILTSEYLAGDGGWKGLTATVSTGVIGYIPFEHFLKYSMWGISIFIGILTAVGLLQKQIDRFQERQEKRRKRYWQINDNEDD